MIDQVIAKFARFKSTCEDFGVPPQNIHVLATEATRTAPNSAEFLGRIRDSIGWETRLLSKEDEGRIGALGVASSSAIVSGLVMDLGGGSTQLTWMIARDGQVITSPIGSVSLPYGAAALTQRLQTARAEGGKMEKLKDEMKYNFKEALERLNLPPELEKDAQTQGGFDLYLCGGGFRGWGYLLMSESRLSPYPIPIINGFRVCRADFYNTGHVVKTASESSAKIFRVSKRRASQVPAVAFLVDTLAETLPSIKSVQFCQGGVREGYLFDRLKPKIRAQDPLLVATAPYAPPSANALCDLIKQSLPVTSSPILSRRIPPSFTPSLLKAVTDLLFAHSNVPKDTRPAAALYSTTTGILASAICISHLDRALISLILSERWPGDLAPAEESLQNRLRQLVSVEEAWWCQYLGRILTLVGDIYPAGRIPDNRWRVRFETVWKQVFKKKQGTTDALHLTVMINSDVDQAVIADSIEDSIEKIEKLGKRKNWMMAREHLGFSRSTEDYGVTIEVEVQKTCG